MPALQKCEEQRRQHRHAGNRFIFRQALAKSRRDEAWDLGVTIHRHTLIAVETSAIAEAIQHDVAIGGEVDWARDQAGNHIVADIVMREAAYDRVVRSFVNEAITNQRAGPGNATVTRVEDTNLGLLVRSHRFDHLHPDLLPLRAGVAEIFFDDPLDEALAHHRNRVLHP